RRPRSDRNFTDPVGSQLTESAGTGAREQVLAVPGLSFASGEAVRSLGAPVHAGGVWGRLALTHDRRALARLEHALGEPTAELRARRLVVLAPNAHDDRDGEPTACGGHTQLSPNGRWIARRTSGASAQDGGTVPRGGTAGPGAPRSIET